MIHKSELRILFELIQQLIHLGQAQSTFVCPLALHQCVGRADNLL